MVVSFGLTLQTPRDTRPTPLTSRPCRCSCTRYTLRLVSLSLSFAGLLHLTPYTLHLTPFQLTRIPVKIHFLLFADLKAPLPPSPTAGPLFPTFRGTNTPTFPFSSTSPEGEAVAAATLVLRAAVHADDGGPGGADGGAQGPPRGRDAPAAEAHGRAGRRGGRGVTAAAHLPVAPGACACGLGLGLGLQP